jgi:TatD DNase family protein
MWVDINAHLERLDDAIEWVNQDCAHHQIQVIWTGFQPDQWAHMQAHPQIQCAFGLHPHAHTARSDWLDQLATHLRAHPHAPVGEIGLDAREGYPSFAQQCADFEAQLALAKSLDRAVIIHAVKAHQAVLAALKRTNTSRFVVHAFSGSFEVANAYLSRGGYISCGGLTTRDPAPRFMARLADLPISRIVLESNAPDLPVTGHQQGHPRDVARIGQVLATRLGLSVPDLAAQTTANAKALFGYDCVQSD